MKLAHPELDNQIIFDENIINVFTIENRAFFVKLVQDILLQIKGEEGTFVLSENNKELKISNYFELIIDPFNLDFNNRKNLNKIYSTLKNISIDENNFSETNKIKNNIFTYIDNILFQYDIPLTYEAEFDITSIFKALDVHILEEESILLEKIIYYISIYIELLNINNFIFINLKQFLNYEELEKLYEFSNYNKVNLLMIEGTFNETKHKCEKHYIIDTDLCEIY